MIPLCLVHDPGTLFSPGFMITCPEWPQHGTDMRTQTVMTLHGTYGRELFVLYLTLGPLYNGLVESNDESRNPS